MSEPLVMFVITKNPRDFDLPPDGDLFIVREHQIAPDGSIKVRMDYSSGRSIEEARGHVPAGLVRCDPSPEDDPVIAEYWV